MKLTILRILIALASIGCLINSSNAQQPLQTISIYAPPLPGQAIVPVQGIAPVPPEMAAVPQETAVPIQPVPVGQGATPFATNATSADGSAAPISPQPAQGAGSDCACGGCGVGCDSPGCDSGGDSFCNACGNAGCSKCIANGANDGIGRLLGLDGIGGNLFNSGGDGCCRPSRIWGGVEYLIWWDKLRHIPALVTTSDVGTPEAIAGVLDQPTTSTLFGNEEIGGDDNAGLRITGGFWLDSQQISGVGARWFEMDTQSAVFSASSNGTPILARPFYNSDPGVDAQDSFVVAHPNLGSGSVNATIHTDVKGGDIFLRYLLYSGHCNRVDIIGGYHHTDIDDQIRVVHSVTSNGGAYGPVGTQLQSLDQFDVENDFDGGEIGVMSESSDGRLTWSLLSKISFGNMRQQVSINGGSSTTVPGIPAANFNYGLLTLPSNISNYERDEFSIVPELNLNVAYNVNSSLQASVGYSLIYWSDVLLAQQTIETNNNQGRSPVINPTQVTGGLVGPNQPVFVFPESKSFWLQGINFGIHGRF